MIKNINIKIDIKNYLLNDNGWLYLKLNLSNNKLDRNPKNYQKNKKVKYLFKEEKCNRNDIYDINISYAYSPFFIILLKDLKYKNNLKEYFYSNNIFRFIKNIQNNNKAELEIDSEGYSTILRTIPLNNNNIILYIENQDNNKYKRYKFKRNYEYYGMFKGSKYRSAKKYIIAKNILVNKLKKELLSKDMLRYIKKEKENEKHFNLFENSKLDILDIKKYLL